MESIVKFESAKGDLVQFTAQEVKDRLCPKATDKELALLMALCQAQKLNPFTKDVYLVKWGESPAQIVTSKEVFTKRAQANPKFEGMEAGVTFLTQQGQIVQREGSMPIKGWTLIGGWCKVYVKGYRVPIYDEVSLDEYNTKKNNWAKMPGTMIRKVALCHALREAFPDDFQGLYGSEEMGVEELVGKDQNNASESTTAPQSDISEPLVIDAVEVVSDDMVQEITEKALTFAELCGKTLDDVMDVLIGANAPEQQRADSVDALTIEQGNTAIEQLDKWIAKSKEAKETTAELIEQDEGEPSKLADEDLEF